MISAVNQTTIIGGTLNGEYKPLNEINSSIQKIINEFDGLVLIREKLLQTRTVGTLWYKGQVLCFTVEDVVRTKKQDDITAIPDSIKKDLPIETFPPSEYYVTLDVTGKESLTKNYVKFPNDKRSKFRSPGVFARVGTEPTAVNFDFDGLKFGGIRIHAGSSEKSSSGCIIVSKTRKVDGTLESDLQASFNITKFIYNNLGIGSGKAYSKMIVINEFEFPPQPVVSSSGIIINESTNKPIDGVTVETIETPPLSLPPLNPSQLPESENPFGISIPNDNNPFNI